MDCFFLAASCSAQNGISNPGTQENHPQITQICTDSGRARSPLRADKRAATECRPYQSQPVKIEAMGIGGS
jgi:hypothetical protein